MKIAKKITTIVCDDARQEVGGKISLMGVYSGDIVVNKIPALLTTLCFVVFLVGIKRKFSNIRVRLTLNETKPLEIVVPSPTDSEIGRDNNLVFSMAPIKIEAAGKAMFEVFIDDDDKPSIQHKFAILLNESN